MQTPKLAVTIPCYNEALCVESTCKRLLEVLNLLAEKGKISQDSYLIILGKLLNNYIILILNGLKR